MEEVVITFRPKAGVGYEVLFNSTPIGTFAIPNEFEGIETLELSELDNLGDILGNALFSGSPSLADFFLGVQPSSRLVFLFQKGAEVLLSLPWEYIKHPESGRPLSLELPFARRIGEGQELKPIEGRPLRVLVVISEPLTLGSFGCRRFHDVIKQETQRLVDDGLLQLAFLRLPSTPDLLARRLLEETPDVVHFIGHGSPGILCFETEAGDKAEVEAEKFNILFGGVKSRLMILTACYSGAFSGRDLVSGTATALVQAGIPSVLAMQLPIEVETAHQLVGDLYAGILKENFDELLKRLRASRFFAERLHAPAQWGIPVFYLQNKSKRLLEGISKGQGSLKEWLPCSYCYGLPEKPELFVGRQQLLVEINSALLKNKVLVLHGLSGMGKSFLALELSHWHRLRGSFPGGIIWIDLQAGGSYALVLERLRLALSISDTSPEALKNRLAFKPTLLVLDSFEKVKDDLELARFLIDLPQTTRVLLTTIERVNIGKIIQVWEMIAEDAFEFFYRRAEKAGWDKVGKEYIQEICGELGYMPLAIELVAPQAASVPMEDLLQKVKGSLNAIAAERPDLPLRHRKVEAALRVSYDQLKPQEKLLFAAMSVFPGDAFHTAISDVTEIPDVVNILRILHGKGLVIFEKERYRLHHLVRRFAMERLEKDFQKRREYEERFATNFLELALWGQENLEIKTRSVVFMTTVELQNLFAAQHWFFEEQRFDECISLSVALAPPLEKAGLWRITVEIVSLSLEAAKMKGDQEKIAGTLNNLGLAHSQIGNFNEAEKYFNESLKISKEIGDKYIISCVLHGLGTVELNRDNLDEAEKYYKRSIKIDKERDDRSGIAKSLHQLGNVELNRDNLDEAERYFKESLKISKEIGDRSLIPFSLGGLGRVFEKKERFDLALRCYLEAAFRFHQLGSPLEKRALNDLAGVVKKMGEEKFKDIFKRIPSELKNYLENLPTSEKSSSL